jgi:alpha-glucoside transport system permease protein
VLIFMPFAISFVGAGIIWKFMYDYRQGDQLGLLNAIITAFGGEPVSGSASRRSSTACC